MVDGRLGFAGVIYAGWALSRVFELETLFRPFCTLKASPDVICFVDDIIAGIFMGTGGLLVAIDLKSGRIRKIGERMVIYNIVPYMSFYTPGTPLLSFGVANIYDK